MAGVINIESNEPTKELNGHLEATVGNYNTKAFGAAVGGTLIEDTLTGRISVYKNKSDGYMENSYLNRDDTNNIDELTTKAQLRWFASDNHTIDLNFMHLDIDNGYDAWTFDNSRVSHADEPGKDKQKTNAFALKSTYQVNPKMHLITSISHSVSDTEYSYDEDWSYVGEFDDSLWPYSSFDQYLRDRKQTDFDMRMVSDLDGRIFNGTTDWTIGVYYKDSTEDLTRNYTYLSAPFNSQYDTQNKAVYGQLDSHITSELTLIAGLRLEQWDAQYSDSNLENIDTDELLTGGKIGLNYQEAVNDSLHLYTSLGLLKAEFDEYVNSVDGTDMTGRAPANSPEYQYNVGFDYMFMDAWTFKANVEGKGSYYFSDRHNEKADAYALLHSSLEYMNGNFSASLWVRNITDEDYQVRGFGSFGNNPGNGYTTELYTQQGAPRTAGLTVSYDF